MNVFYGEHCLKTVASFLCKCVSVDKEGHNNNVTIVEQGKCSNCGNEAQREISLLCRRCLVWSTSYVMISRMTRHKSPWHKHFLHSFSVQIWQIQSLADMYFYDNMCKIWTLSDVRHDAFTKMFHKVNNKEAKMTDFFSWLNYLAISGIVIIQVQHGMCSNCVWMY